MKDYSEEDVKKLCKENIKPFKVNCVSISGDYIDVRFEKRQIIADYIKENRPRLLIFKNVDDNIYSLKCKYVNIDGHVKTVYILQDYYGNIIDVFGMYEIKNPEKFGNRNLSLTINKIIEEVC